MTAWAPPRYAHRVQPHRGGVEEARVAIVGGGLVGLTAALDLARRGVASVLLDEDDTVSAGSRAICFSQRTLEIMGRLGIGPRFLKKGITWNRGRVFFRDREAYSFDLLPESGHEYPAFVNLQQYYAEQWLVEECEVSGLVDLRWRSRVAGVAPREDGAVLEVETPSGPYRLHAEWVLACDGVRSQVRRALDLPFTGQVFDDRFLIADVRMRADFPTERWFWFDPPFHPGQSVLLHKQPDDIWRIDFQLGRDADGEAEREPERVRARVAAMLGKAVPFDLEWVSVYTFRCRRLERFRHGRVLFLGDAAHQVSPFGARGGNGGVQDADNLGWKLAMVLRGEAPERLLDSFDAERVPAADENILHSSRATDFITPKGAACRAYRDAVLELAHDLPLARPFVNSGRLSRPAVLRGSPLNGPDEAPRAAPPGTACPDAPIRRDGQPDWLLRQFGGGFTLLAREAHPVRMEGLRVVELRDSPRPGALHDHSGLAAARLGLAPGECALLRPDQHIAARFATTAPDPILAALRKAVMA
ncbi:FAD-dependent oxidoreductase [Sabulicella glaciei]|uniref:FAD-dependent oxidoreductase n=1 Tax=Sabulicella glaciei TaxID=2984948 RepID=A0ABT3NUZ8_9PROT|nr:FAD-dependent oxidoreductase [Roseococcus sp. MDT2-1-1]MCW8085966.1 FAD-dependent oxidoreductase [Roseococcus sp. MDT2-1-1]